jgi:HEAT repeat protein
MNQAPALPRHPFLGPTLALLAALAACTEEEAAERVDPAQVQREIRALVTALTPADAAALPVEKSAWFERRKKTLDRLRAQSREHGLEALRVYTAGDVELPEVRAGLLDVAAHAAPEETEAELVRLVTEFGDDLLLRTKAAQLLGETRPERALEILQPILDERYDGRTYPPMERLLEAWVSAARKLGRDPAPVLAEIATDLNRTQDVRHLATRALGDSDSPRSRQALQALMVESSGNAYIRILATQSLQRILPREEFCPLVESVLSKEVEQNFQMFLDDVLQEACR